VEITTTLEDDNSGEVHVEEVCRLNPDEHEEAVTAASICCFQQYFVTNFSDSPTSPVSHYFRHCGTANIW